MNDGRVDMNARGTGPWHSLKCLESGTVLFEAKDGPYHPLDEDKSARGQVSGMRNLEVE